MKKDNDYSAKNILYILKRYHLTQKELAKMLGISNTTISTYINGKVAPSLSVLFGVSEQFGISIDCLINVDMENANQTDIASLTENYLNALNCCGYNCNKDDTDDLLRIIDVIYKKRA